MTTPTLANIEELRRQHYNATVTRRRQVNDELLILRVRTDADEWPFEAGQYTTLCLGYWEPRADGCDEEHLAENLETRLVQRAYSISSPILDEQNRPVRVNELGQMEFYVVLIRHAESRTLAQIAHLRGVSTNTVKSQVRQIFRKLNVDSRVALVRKLCP